MCVSIFFTLWSSTFRSGRVGLGFICLVAAVSNLDPSRGYILPTYPPTLHVIIVSVTWQPGVQSFFSLACHLHQHDSYAISEWLYLCPKSPLCVSLRSCGSFAATMTDRNAKNILHSRRKNAQNCYTRSLSPGHISSITLSQTLSRNGRAAAELAVWSI